MAQTLCLSDSDSKTMAEPQNELLNNGFVKSALQYLGYLFVALLVIIFGWLFRLLGNWITKKFNEYVERIENAVGKVEGIAKDIKQLKESDAEIIERLEKAEKAQQVHAEIQKDQSRDINAIKKHLKLD